MDMDDLVERKIREAMEQGQFDDLPGQGRPQNHDDYFALPEEARQSTTVLKNAGYLPAEVELCKEIAALRVALMGSAEDEERQHITRALNDKLLELNLLLERGRRAPRRAPRWLTGPRPANFPIGSYPTILAGSRAYHNRQIGVFVV